jgi:hypothetical protein
MTGAVRRREEGCSNQTRIASKWAWLGLETRRNGTLNESHFFILFPVR